MIKHLSIILFFCLYFQPVTSQNLVANSSFEEENICESHIPCSPKGWHSVSNIPYGYDNDLQGNFHKKRSLSFLIFSKKMNFNTYWQTTLLCPLQKDEEYTVKLFIYSSNEYVDLSQFGICFTNQMIFSKNDTIIQKEESLSLQNVVLKKSKQPWYELSFQYKSKDTAHYLLIGNFNTAKQERRNLPSYIKYYIDQISVVPLKKRTCTEIQQRTDSLYAVTSRHSNIFSSKAPVKSFIQLPVNEPVYVTDTFAIDMQVFDFDSYRLKDTTQLSALIQKIDREKTDTIYFNGYTDNSGSIEYNMKLSFQRAAELKTFFQNRLGITESRLIASGKGISTTYFNAALNRRVEIIVRRRVSKKEE